MNEDFKSWARSTAFHLSLCGWAITEILIFQQYEETAFRGGYPNTGVSLASRSTADYLRRRGLIERCGVEGYGGNWLLTEAGMHVAALLKIAGFTA